HGTPPRLLPCPTRRSSDLSASYALVSFKSCYLKAHHPAEFMAAVISNGGGYYSTFAYVSECGRMRLQVLLPDINDSDQAYTGREDRKSTRLNSSHVSISYA